MRTNVLFYLAHFLWVKLPLLSVLLRDRRPGIVFQWDVQSVASLTPLVFLSLCNDPKSNCKSWSWKVISCFFWRRTQSPIYEPENHRMYAAGWTTCGTKTLDCPLVMNFSFLRISQRTWGTTKKLCPTTASIMSKFDNMWPCLICMTERDALSLYRPQSFTFLYLAIIRCEAELLVWLWSSWHAIIDFKHRLFSKEPVSPLANFGKYSQFQKNEINQWSRCLHPSTRGLQWKVFICFLWPACHT